MLEHKNKVVKGGFTSKYNINHLVYYEEFNNPQEAILREKQIKGWLRIKKIKLVEDINPGWMDLSEGWFETEEEKVADNHVIDIPGQA